MGLKYCFGLNLILLLIFVMLSGLIAPAVLCLPQNGQIEIPYVREAPNIDGRWSTTGEWEGATETKVQNEFGWNAYFRFQHNRTHFFALVDYITDQSERVGDVAVFCFDTNNDGGTELLADDYILTLWVSSTNKSGLESDQGTGTGGDNYWDCWTGIDRIDGTQYASGLSSINDPYESGKDHMVYEFQLPLRFLGTKDIYGFYSAVMVNTQENLLEIPINAGGHPSTLGNKIFPPAPGNWLDIKLLNGTEPSPTSSPIPTSTPTPAPTLTHTSTPVPTPTDNPSPTPEPRIGISLPIEALFGIGTTFAIVIIILSLVILKRKK